jgi:hypothetical protein
MPMEIIQTIALTLGVGWASGINLYAAVFTLGYLGATGQAQLPPGLEVLTDPLVMGAAAIMYLVEFFADKTPGVDTGWDVLHTFVRIPAGAVLAAGAASGLQMNEAVGFAAFLLGGSLAGASHFTKAGSRVLINTSPEPVSNWSASIAEDLLVIAGLWASLNHPWLFLVALLLFLALLVWLLPRLWRALATLFGKIRGLFSSRESRADQADTPPPADADATRPGDHPRDRRSLLRQLNPDKQPGPNHHSEP